MSISDPEHPEPPARIALLDWRALRQNTLLGFATVRVWPGLVIHDLTLHRNGERVYAMWPGRAQIDREGRVVTDEFGKRKYAPIIEVPDRDLRERLSAAVVELVRRRDPEALA